MLRPRLIVVIVITAILIWAMFAPPEPVKHLKRAIYSTARSPLKALDNLFDYFKKISRLPYADSEKTGLKRRIVELQNKTVKLDEIALENERLRELLGFKKEIEKQSIPASVIGRDPNNWSSVVFIDKGRGDGIRNDMVVISGNGLIGRIREPGEAMSKVMLINDIDSKVGAIVQNSRETGLLTGTAQGECKLIYLSLESEVSAGDKVLTSGMGGIYPKGLLIGEIIKVAKEKGRLYKFAIIQPSGKFSKLEEVLCIE